MRFGPVPTREAEGAVLAHSVAAGGVKLRKGRCLCAEDLRVLAEAGVAEVTVARLEPGDVGEDAAAEAVASRAAPDPGDAGMSVSAPFTGRVNLFAETAGLFRIDRAGVDALNRVDPSITLATLPDWARVRARQMVATIKVIPYAVPGEALARAIAAAGSVRPRVHGFVGGSAAIILTRTPGFKESLLRKGGESVVARLDALGFAARSPVVVAHETEAVAGAVREAAGDLVLILGASATSDTRDVCPEGVRRAGGRVARFGMPVDPGNLLFLGEQGGRPVVGLPGCARSPALNGADWVLERLAAGIDIGDEDIAAMGVGGLLKEIPVRPQPRAGGADPSPARPRIAAVILAAGASTRMRGRDKLLEEVGGRPILRAVAEAALASRADEVIVVLPPDAGAREAALAGLALTRVVAQECRQGMAASLRAGVAEAAGRVEAVVVLLADMPEVGQGQIDRLIAAFDPEEGREIARAMSGSGRPGHPVLFGRRFFETLAGLTGDQGAREVLREAAEFVTEVATQGEGAVIDLDTPEAWAEWRARAEV